MITCSNCAHTLFAHLHRFESYGEVRRQKSVKERKKIIDVTNKQTNKNAFLKLQQTANTKRTKILPYTLFCVFVCVIFFISCIFSPSFSRPFPLSTDGFVLQFVTLSKSVVVTSTTQGLTQPIKLNPFIWFASPKTWRISFAVISLLFLFPLLGNFFRDVYFLLSA